MDNPLREYELHKTTQSEINRQKFLRNHWLIQLDDPMTRYSEEFIKNKILSCESKIKRYEEKVNDISK